MLLLHEGRDVGPLLLREAVERPDELVSAPHDPCAWLVAGNHGQALLGEGGMQGLWPVAARPCLFHDLAHVPEVDALAIQDPALVRGDGAARTVGLRPQASRQPCGHLRPGPLEVAQGAPVMPSERRRLAELVLGEATSRLDLDLIEAGPRHETIRSHSRNDQVEMRPALAGDAGLVVQHAGAAVLGHAEMAQHDVAGEMQFGVGHLPAGANADVEEGRVGLGPIPHQLHVAQGCRQIDRQHVVDAHGDSLVHLRLQEMRGEVPGIAPGAAMRDDVADHPGDPA
jgi:hypothetical protein